MGRPCPCDITIPVRPSLEVCVAGEDGLGYCFDGSAERSVPILNYVCLHPQNDRIQEEWIAEVLRQCRR